MQIWELRFEDVNTHAVLVPVADEGGLLGIFMADGKPKNWQERPKVTPFTDKKNKKPKPRTDASYLIAGAIVLNKKAHAALKDFLQPFGQLLELDCDGEIEYFYNVTRLLECVDYAQSEKKGKSVVREIFLPDTVPSDIPLIFKDPYTAKSRIYLNQAGKQQFEQISASAGLSGLRFVEAGKGLL